MKLYTDIYFLCDRLIFWSATSLRVYLELREMDYIGALNFELVDRLDPAILVDAFTSTPINPPDVVDGTPRNSLRGGGHGRGAPRGGGRA